MLEYAIAHFERNVGVRIGVKDGIGKLCFHIKMLTMCRLDEKTSALQLWWSLLRV